MPATDLQTINGMLQCIAAQNPRPAYADWLRLIFACQAAGGDAAVETMKGIFPPEHGNEYERRTRTAPSKITAGTLVYMARQAGWRGDLPAGVFNPQPRPRPAPSKITLSSRAAANSFGYVEYTNSVHKRGNFIEVYNLSRDLYGTPGIEAYRGVFLQTAEIFDHIKKNNGSSAGYAGPVSAEEIFVDIDSRDNLEAARHTAIVWLRAIPVAKAYYTGMKGFRIAFEHPEFTKLLRYNETPALVKDAISRLAARVNAPVAPDLSIYKATAIIRIPNSQHPKTGLYMIPLSCDEIEKIDIHTIRSLAKNQRTL